MTTEPRVHVDHFTDPGCPFAFSAEPSRIQAKWHFGDQVEFEDHMIVLSESPEELLAKGFTTARMAAGFSRLARQYGMPITDRELPRLHHTRPACALVVGVRRHRPDKAERVLRELRKLCMAGNLLDEQSTLRAAAEAAGLDADDAITWAGEPATIAQLQDDWHRARTPGAAARGPLRHKLSSWEGGLRYSAPSWVVTAGNTGGSLVGDGLEVPGFQPYAAYEVALGNVASDLERRDAPASAAEALEWAEGQDIGPLATAEVAALLGVGIDEARSELEQLGDASFEPAGLDGYWSVARVRETA
jgi:predicted DsbA family dithiol-disulfide isomerase